MNRDKLIHKLGNKIIKDIGSRRGEWAHIVMVGSFENGEAQMNGFAYDNKGAHVPVAPRDFDILETLRELREAMAAADRKAPWVACLFRIDRSTGEIAGEFEYENSGRWTITPTNVRKRADELAH